MATVAATIATSPPSGSAPAATGRGDAGGFAALLDGPAGQADPRQSAASTAADRRNGHDVRLVSDPALIEKPASVAARMVHAATGKSKSATTNDEAPERLETVNRQPPLASSMSPPAARTTTSPLKVMKPAPGDADQSPAAINLPLAPDPLRVAPAPPPPVTSKQPMETSGAEQVAISASGSLASALSDAPATSDDTDTDPQTIDHPLVHGQREPRGPRPGTAAGETSPSAPPQSETGHGHTVSGTTVTTAPTTAAEQARAADATDRQAQVPTSDAVPSAVPTQGPGPLTPSSHMDQTGLYSGSIVSESSRAVAMRIGRAIANGQSTLTVELNPARLGRVAVHLAFQNGGVDVRMVMSREETFQAFTQDRSGLEQQLAQAGIDLGSGGLDLRFNQTRDPEPTPDGRLLSDDSVAPIIDADSPIISSGSGLLNIVA